jgi:hypothetical protein
VNRRTNHRLRLVTPSITIGPRRSQDPPGESGLFLTAPHASSSVPSFRLRSHPVTLFVSTPMGNRFKKISLTDP